MEISTNLAYIIGSLEDGCLSHRPEKGEYVVEFEQKDLNWIKSLSKKFKLVFGVPGKIGKHRDYFRLRIYSKQIFNQLSELRERVLDEFEKIPLDAKKAFIRAFFDTEGTVNSSKRFQLSVYSTNKKLICLTNNFLNEIKIPTGKLSRSRHVLMLPIYGKTNLQKFQEQINFDHIPKKIKLKMLIGS